jgi:glucosamine--fructose-6-phosphate aminotransferase (isomerizing)
MGNLEFSQDPSDKADLKANSSHTLQEILTQPLAWQAALNEVKAKQDAIKQLWATGNISEVVVTGCGSTYYLSQAVAPLLQKQLGIPARAVPASELLLFPEMVISKGAKPLLLTISRSGRTTETIRAAKFFKATWGSPVLHIGCYPDSELAAESDLAITIPEGQEESVVQTRSFSAMLVAAQALAAVVSENNEWEAMFELPALGQKIIEEQHALARYLGQEAGFERFYFLGSGLQYGLASEANLKMKEMSLAISEAFHFLEFRHGPMSMVNEKTLVVGLLSERARSFELDVLREMRGLGGKTLALSDEVVPAEVVTDFQVSFNSGLPETRRAVLNMPFLQLIGYYRAIANGQNPDQPHNLSAVIVLKPEN